MKITVSLPNRVGELHKFLGHFINYNIIYISSYPQDNKQTGMNIEFEYSVASGLNEGSFSTLFKVLKRRWGWDIKVAEKFPLDFEASRK